MRKTDVITHFGSIGATAKAVGITTAAIRQWDEIIPRGSAYTIQVITGGRLQVDPSVYPPKKKPANNLTADNSSTAA
jgi:hypothetical protein